MAEREPNWAKIKAEYLKGGSSYRDLATKHKVNLSTLEKRAKREAWTDQLRQVCGEVAAELPARIATVILNEAERITKQHLDDWEKFRGAVMAMMTGDPNPLTEHQFRVAVASAQTYERIQKGQRLSLGLDKPEPPKVEQSAQAVMVVPPDSEEWQSLVDTGSVEA